MTKLFGLGTSTQSTTSRKERAAEELSTNQTGVNIALVNMSTNSSGDRTGIWKSSHLFIFKINLKCCILNLKIFFLFSKISQANSQILLIFLAYVTHRMTNSYSYHRSNRMEINLKYLKLFCCRRYLNQTQKLCLWRSLLENSIL